LLSLAMVSLIANIVFDLVLMRWYGVAGIALSTTAVHAIGVVYISALILRRVRRA
jgi:putative peptidoglycan lipid II flippase